MWSFVYRHVSVALALLMVGSLAATAQQVSGGGSAVPFLLITPNARFGGMGEAGTGIADDISAVYYNIGGMAYQANTQVSLTYSKWLPQFNADLHYGFFTGSKRFDDLDGTLSAHIVYLDLGEFQQTFESGAPGAKFRSQEFAVGVGYSTKLAEDIGAGIQARYIQSNLSSVQVSNESGSGVGRSVGFDVGVLWTPETDWGMPADFLKLGATLTNIGPKIHYIDIAQADPLPTTFRLGTGLHLVEDEFNDLTFSFDITKLLVNRPDSVSVDPVPVSLITSWGNGKGVEVGVGAEYWYEKLVALRAGYFTESANSGNRQFLTFGAGIRYDELGLDFSYINTIDETHPLANTLRFTLVVDLDYEAKKK